MSYATRIESSFYLTNLLHFFRYCVYILFNHWWNESRPHNGCVSIITDVWRHFQRYILCRSTSWGIRTNLGYSVQRWTIGNFKVNLENRKFEITGVQILYCSFDPDPTTRHTWFSLIIGGGFTYLSLYAVNQTQVQRLLTVKDLKASQKALFLNWPILSLLSLCTSFSGLAIYYLYSTCDPLLQGRVSSRDQVWNTAFLFCLL